MRNEFQAFSMELDEFAKTIKLIFLTLSVKFISSRDETQKMLFFKINSNFFILLNIVFKRYYYLVKMA